MRARRPVAPPARAAIALCGPLLLATAAAQTPEPGQWRVERFRVEVQQLAWGPLCGVAPAGHGWKVSPRQLDLEVGAERLRFTSKRRSFTSDGCEPHKAPLKRTGHERLADGWLTRCASGDGQETVEHRTIVRDATHVDFVTTRTYAVDPKSATGAEDLPLGTARGAQEVWYSDGTQWKKGTRAEAQAARQCVLREIREEQLQRLPQQAAPCAAPGPLATLRMTPESADLLAGERKCFKVAAADAAGCPLAVPPLSYFVDPAGSAQVDAQGCVVATEQLAEATAAALTAAHGEIRAGALLRLTPRQDTAKTDIETLVKRSRSDKVRNLVGRVRTGSLSVRAAPRAEASETTRHVVSDTAGKALTGVLAVGALAILGAAVALFLARRKKQLADQLEETRAAIEEAREAKRSRKPTEAPMAQRATLPEVGQGLVCPKCQFEFESGTYCPYDRTKLEPLQRNARHTLFIPTSGGMICPVCQTRYPTKARFCGKDRSPLVPADAYKPS